MQNIYRAEVSSVISVGILLSMNEAQSASDRKKNFSEVGSSPHQDVGLTSLTEPSLMFGLSRLPGGVSAGMRVLSATVSAAWAAYTVLIHSGESALCPTNTTHMAVSSSADTKALVAALACAGGGVFEVSWLGNVVISETIEISGGSRLAVTGTGPLPPALDDETGADIASRIDGGATTGIFFVSGGSSITLQRLIIQGGYATEGGAITTNSSASASGKSTVNVTDCLFLDNHAITNGGKAKEMKFGFRNQLVLLILKI